MEPAVAAPHPKHLRTSSFVIALFSIVSAALAQQSRITKPIDNSQRVTLTGHVSPKAIPANDRGRVAPGLKLSYVTLTLAPSAAQKADLANLLAGQQNPSSPDYHRWLTTAQYADRFGASAEDVSQITQWLRGQGLSIVNVAQGRNWIAVSGAAAQIEAAFATEIHQYEVDGETHHANATNPSVPAAIAEVVLSIRGLDDFRMKPRLQKPRASGSACGGESHCLAPNDVATIYDILPAYSAGIDGTGQAIAIAGQSDIDLSDIQNFRNAFGLPANLPRTLLVPGTHDPGISSGDREESDLDLEWSGAVARNASITFVYSENVMDAVNYAIDQNLAKVISVSYGQCEPLTGSAQTLTFQSWAQQANAQGITWFNATGDAGAADCYTGDNTVSVQEQEIASVDTPASVPEVTGVGGTQFVDSSGTYWDSSSGAALSYIPETTWNTTAADGEPSASGGGLSIYFQKPSWQVGPGVAANNARNVPDVALNADPDNDGYLVYTDGNNSPVVYGGTSCPTPVMAGIAALLNQYLVSTGSQQTAGLGNINPQLYSLRQSNPAVFNDIVTGNNTVTVSAPSITQGCGRKGCTSASVTVSGYNAGIGYDDVTGLGSVNAWRLITGWKGEGTVVTTPATASLSLVSNLSNLGQSDIAFLTATATASDGVTTPQGVVQFSAGGTSLSPVTLVGAGGVSTATLQLSGDELPSGSTTITATYEGSSSSAPVTSSVTLNVREVGPNSGGTPAIQGLTDAASYQQRYSPGMILTVWGASLAPSGTAESAASVPLPLTMAGIAATVNGVAAPLYYVSPTQLNIQVPYQTALGSPATLAINNNGQISTRTLEFAATSPGIFTNTANTIVPYTTAARGQTITLYFAGAGAVAPALATGSAPASTTPVSLLPAPAKTTVTVGGMQASTPFIGIPWTLAGVVQVNFQVPSGVPTGAQRVIVNVNGTPSASAILNVTN
jgi:uncharacterized protein (TIGR03437 family)